MYRSRSKSSTSAKNVRTLHVAPSPPCAPSSLSSKPDTAGPAPFKASGLATTASSLRVLRKALIAYESDASGVNAKTRGTRRIFHLSKMKVNRFVVRWWRDGRVGDELWVPGGQRATPVHDLGRGSR